jgi:pyruvate/2-oxoglutarate dehydrogenase complex dihydrolipoamide acyltransferase (E2) component
MAYEFRLPDIGEGLTEAEVVRWLLQPGDEVVVDAPLVEVETDKAVVEIPSPKGGVLLHQGAPEGSMVQVGEVLAVIGEAGESWDGEGEAASPIVGTLPPPSGEGRRGASPVQALPVVRKLAAELGVDLANVRGTGPGGRITREDVEAATSGRAGGDEERVPLSRLRRTIAEHMTRSWREIPHVTTFGEADASRLLDARRKLADRRDGPVPLEAFLIRSVLPALLEFPEFNASLDGNEVVLKRRFGIGVAVDTPEGLIVPVVRDADQRSLEELADEVVRLAQAARERKLVPDDLAGLTFTISNIGAVGGGYGTPIIPYGTTAILSVGRAEDRAVVRGGRVAVAPLFSLSLSFDHRVIDGAMGRRFLAMVIEQLAEPPD